MGIPRVRYRNAEPIPIPGYTVSRFYARAPMRVSRMVNIPVVEALTSPLLVPAVGVFGGGGGGGGAR